MSFKIPNSLDGLCEEKLEGLPLKPFKCWAFGDDYDDNQVPLIFMHAWNLRHSDKLELHEDGDIYEDLVKMVEIYKQETHDVR